MTNASGLSQTEIERDTVVFGASYFDMCPHIFAVVRWGGSLNVWEPQIDTAQVVYATCDAPDKNMSVVELRQRGPQNEFRRRQSEVRAVRAMRKKQPLDLLGGISFDLWTCWEGFEPRSFGLLRLAASASASASTF